MHEMKGGRVAPTLFMTVSVERGSDERLPRILLPPSPCEGQPPSWVGISLFTYAADNIPQDGYRGSSLDFFVFIFLLILSVFIFIFLFSFACFDLIFCFFLYFKFLRFFFLFLNHDLGGMPRHANTSIRGFNY